MNSVKRISLCLFLFISFAGCAGLTPQQQRILTGGAIEAAGGAAIGAISGGSAATGALIGGAAGAVGGAIVHEAEKEKVSSNHKTM
jgi:osmotically inducible lipoprotein OsmB